MSSDSSSECEGEDEGWLDNETGVASTSLLSHTILHLDVDCFYCQCHEVQDPSLRTVPFAIGQKHIIVTSNYVARQFGVKKLMSKMEAKRTCPSLRIIDGSDLTEFRKKSHLIYRVFRSAVQQLTSESDVDMNICVKKGGMDEIFADISSLVNERVNERAKLNRKAGTCTGTLKSDLCLANPNVAVGRQKLPCFIYGNDHESQHISIAEDQSGALATISYGLNVTSNSSARSHARWGCIQEREKCKKRLLVGAKIALQLKEMVYSKTGFTTCIGVSVSPMLSKLASDLKVRETVF